MESWQKVFREGFAPLASIEELEALKDGLVNDDPSLFQGVTTRPPALQCMQHEPCEGGCLFSYAGWKGQSLHTVAEVEEYFAEMCFEIDKLLGEPAACRWLLNWFDDTPRDEVRRRLIPEINNILDDRFDEAIINCYYTDIEEE